MKTQRTNPRKDINQRAAAVVEQATTRKTAAHTAPPPAAAVAGKTSLKSGPAKDDALGTTHLADSANHKAPKR